MNDLSLASCLFFAAQSALISITVWSTGKSSFNSSSSGASLSSPPRLGVEFGHPFAGSVHQPPQLQSKAHILETATSWRSLGKQVLFSGSQSSHTHSLPIWIFHSGVTHMAFPWTPFNVFSILVLVFLNPSAEFQLWARQLSPDYFLCVYCQASFLI